MNEFINNILLRHLDPITNIVPRLPGKFEPVNFAADTPGFAEGTDFVQEVSKPQPVMRSVKEDNGVIGINTVFPQQDQISGKQVFQHAVELLPANKNADEAEWSKNLIPLMQGLPGEKKSKTEAPFEMPGKQEKITPAGINAFNERQTADDNAQPDNLLINKPGDENISAIKEGTLHHHISIIKQKIVKASAEKKNNFSEDKKTVQSALIKPVVNNINTGAKLNTQPVLNEQPATSVIKVSIGRIEVRAVTNSTPQKISRPAIQKPNLTLDEYLKRKN